MLNASASLNSRMMIMGLYYFFKSKISLKGISIGDLFRHVIESQSLQVDVISGATLTSKAHLKALENALEQAKRK